VKISVLPSIFGSRTLTNDIVCTYVALFPALSTTVHVLLVLQPEAGESVNAIFGDVSMLSAKVGIPVFDGSNGLPHEIVTSATGDMLGEIVSTVHTYVVVTPTFPTLSTP
jgi:hypothetical protein